jgi:hypothetical protein
MMKPRCKELVSRHRGWHVTPCVRAAGPSGYCAQHAARHAKAPVRHAYRVERRSATGGLQVYEYGVVAETPTRITLLHPGYNNYSEARLPWHDDATPAAAWARYRAELDAKISATRAQLVRLEVELAEAWRVRDDDH